MNSGYASFNSIFGSEQVFGDGKIATLFFDQIYFNSIIFPKPELLFEHIEVDEKVSYTAKLILAQHWHIAKPTISFGQVFWDKLPLIQVRLLEEILLNSNYNSAGATSLTQDLWKTGNYMIGELISQKSLYPNASYIGNSIETDFLNGLIDINEKKNKFRSCILTQIPDFSVLGWNEIAELRRSPFLQSFVNKMQDIFLKGNNDNRLNDEFETAKESLLNDTRPNLPTCLINSVITTLFTPASILSGIKDTFKEYRRSNENGWVYFLLDTNNMIKKNRI